jgi:hypothetical protein
LQTANVWTVVPRKHAGKNYLMLPAGVRAKDIVLHDRTNKGMADFLLD